MKVLGSSLLGVSTAKPWRSFLSDHFSAFTTAPFAQHHLDLWEWGAAIIKGTRPRPFIACWPRGGAKSTTVELLCAWLGSQPDPVRNYVLYVSETQTQADRHVQAIAGMLERVGISRAVNEYGASKGWRRTEVRAANGFNVTAMGLDSAMRGAKLDEFRPDLIVFDDIDGRHDSANTVAKKIETITTSILPAGSTDAATIVVQNMIHENGIMAQLIDGRADFLHDRLPAEPIPAIRDLQTERITVDDGTIRYRIVAGEATWGGQSIETCEKQINEWGLAAFKREAQHEVAGGGDGIFKRHWWRYWQPRGANLPPILVRMPDGEARYVYADEQPAWWDKTAQSWDMTFKGEPRGTAKKNVKRSYTVGLVGATSGVNGYVLDMFRERVEFPDAVRAVRSMHAKHPNVAAKYIEDKANGPAIISTLRDEIPGIIAVSVVGTKEARAESSTARVEAGNWYLPHPDLPGAEWVPDFIKELSDFPHGAHDDIADAFSQLDDKFYSGVGDLSALRKRMDRELGRR